MTKRELKDWWDSDEEETSWAESALPMLGLMVVIILFFIAAMLYVAGSQPCTQRFAALCQAAKRGR